MVFALVMVPALVLSSALPLFMVSVLPVPRALALLRFTCPPLFTVVPPVAELLLPASTTVPLLMMVPPV